MRNNEILFKDVRALRETVLANVSCCEALVLPVSRQSCNLEQSHPLLSEAVFTGEFITDADVRLEIHQWLSLDTSYDLITRPAWLSPVSASASGSHPVFAGGILALLCY